MLHMATVEYYALTHSHTHARACARAHTHTHIYTHTPTHTHTPKHTRVIVRMYRDPSQAAATVWLSLDH